MTQMTVEVLKEVLPRNLRGNATQEFADLINNCVDDPEVAREVRDNFLTYTKILTEGRFKTEDYLNAVTYATHKIMGYSNKDAYARTFPERWKLLALKGTSDKDISAYVSAYARNKMVNMILEQATIPTWLLNQDVFQKAINTQLELMTTANSEKVRQEAANSILTHLKAPEVKKVQLEMGLSNQGGINELMETMTRLAEQQKAIIAGGGSAKEIGRTPLFIEQEVIDVDFTESDDKVSLFP